MELWLGAAVLALTLILLTDAFAARRGRSILAPVPLTAGARGALMTALALAAGAMILPAFVPALRRGLFAFCALCPVSPATLADPPAPQGFLRTFLLGVWYYAATVLPVFVLACLLSGLFATRADRNPVRGPVSAFALAAVLPVCSCGAVPLGRAIIDRGGRAREGIIFIATAPLLSPIILFLAITILGPGYTLARVLGTVAIAGAAAVVATRLLGPARPEGPTPGGLPRLASGPGGSVRLAAWRYVMGLARYVLYGVVLGALFTALVPPGYVAALARAGVLSLAASVVAGVPVSMCAGEEILLAAPLVGMGLTMGHAVAFALASTGICLASVPLLVAALGRRATVALVSIYLVVPFAVGIVVNALPIALALRTELF